LLTPFPCRSLAVAQSEHEDEDQGFIDAISDRDGE
jgi:hypothetical protein